MTRERVLLGGRLDVCCVLCAVAAVLSHALPALLIRYMSFFLCVMFFFGVGRKMRSCCFFVCALTRRTNSAPI